MKNHKSLAPVFNNEGKRYPRSFKEEVVKSVLSVIFPSKEAARRYYGIGGGSTILEWLEEYICIEDILKNLETMKEKQKDLNFNCSKNWNFCHCIIRQASIFAEADHRLVRGRVEAS